MYLRRDENHSLSSFSAVSCFLLLSLLQAEVVDGEKLSSLILDRMPLKEDKTECRTAALYMAKMVAQGHKGLLGGDFARLSPVLDRIAQVRWKESEARLGCRGPDLCAQVVVNKKVSTPVFSRQVGQALRSAGSAMPPDVSCKPVRRSDIALFTSIFPGSEQSLDITGTPGKRGHSEVGRWRRCDCGQEVSVGERMSFLHTIQENPSLALYSALTLAS